MDYRKINSHIILFLIVIIVGVTISMIGRRVMLERGFDTGTANLTFVIVLGVCIIAYLVILATLAHTIVPWVMKKLPKKKTAPIAEPEDNALNETIPEEAEQGQKDESLSQLINVDTIRQDSEKCYKEKLANQIEMFIEYSHLTMAPYVTNNELLLLDGYIECYARNTSLPDNLIPIKPKRLKNTDIFHFGWNMAHFFDIGKKYEVIPWLKIVFSDLRELEYSSIKGKLYSTQIKKVLIPNNDEIPKFLAQKKG